MSINSHITRLPKKGARIVAVEPEKREIHAQLQAGQVVPVAAYSFTSAFRWPMVGENWVLKEENGTYYLDHIWEEQETTVEKEEEEEKHEAGTTEITYIEEWGTNHPEPEEEKEEWTHALQWPPHEETEEEAKNRFKINTIKAKVQNESELIVPKGAYSLTMLSEFGGFGIERIAMWIQSKGKNELTPANSTLDQRYYFKEVGSLDHHFTSTFYMPVEGWVELLAEVEFREKQNPYWVPREFVMFRFP